MTRVYVKPDGPCWEVTVAGHAGAGEAGKDIVCAGISALLGGLVDIVERDGSMAERFQGDGAVRIRFYRTKRAGSYLRMFVQGIEAVAQDHPEHCAIEVQGRP